MSRPDPDTDLATLVRDAAPRPSEEFLERLDGRVAERFDAPERPRRQWIAGWPKWRIAGGLAAACAAGAIVVVAVGGSSDSNVDRFTPFADHTATHALGTAAKPSESARQAAGAGKSTPTPSAAAPAPAPGVVAPSSP